MISFGTANMDRSRKQKETTFISEQFWSIFFYRICVRSMM